MISRGDACVPILMIPWLVTTWAKPDADNWVHIVLALVFVIGLVSHVFTVTFLAEYIAEGQEIIWPHFSW